MTKAGEQPTITEALADELEAVFKRHSLASSYAIQSRVYEVANICLENRKEILNALRTTSLAAQDGLRRKMERAELAFAAIKSSHAKSSSAYKIASETLAYLLQPENDTALSAIKGDKS